MKLLSAACLLLLSSNASVVFGSNVRGTEADSQQERSLGPGKGGPNADESNPFDPPSKPGKVSTYACDEGCDIGAGPPVCGVDGTTYFNECLAVCQEVEIERNGACPGDPPMNMASFVGKGRVTREQMDAFKDKKFKLVAKRKPHFGGKPEGRPFVDGDDSGDEGADMPLSAKATRVLADGLEYVAEYSMDDIPEGVDSETTEGDMPEIIDPDSTDGHGRRLSGVMGVIGEDTRIQEDGFDWPNRRIVQLDYWEDGSYIGLCTGTIIGVNKVLTAAHCVFDTGNRLWTMPDRVAPGRSGSWDPWGTWRVQYPTIYKAYADGAGFAYDVAVLTIASHSSKGDIGSYMGYLGLRTHPCMWWFTESDWRITGYPGDKPAGTLWNTGVCDDWNYICGFLTIRHWCDVAWGNSGSAIRDGNNRVVAVDVASIGWDGSTTNYNIGVALNIFHMANIQYW